LATLLLVIGLILGTAAPASLAAVTSLQWVIISLTLADYGVKGVKDVKKLDAFIHTPQFQAWAAANGDYVIRTYPGNVN